MPSGWVRYILDEFGMEFDLVRDLLRMSVGYTGSLETRVEQIVRAVKKAGLGQ